MGSGKSTTGKRLSSVTGWEFIDLDSYIEEVERRSVTEIFSREGEEYFRRAEADALRSIVTENNVIIATGGGTPCFYDNMDYMNSTGYTVYLRMSPSALASRLANSNVSRPKLPVNDMEEMKDLLEKMLEEREPFYQRARKTVEGLSIDINQLADHLQDLDPYTPL